ncbi:MAG: ATP-binding protein, partial [Anaerolineales bacterium]
GASSGALLLLAEDGEALELVNALGYSEELINTIRRVSLSGPTLPVLEVLRTGEPIWLPSQAAFNARYPDHAKTGNEAIAFLPLRVNERNLGSLIISFAEVREFSPEEQIFLLTLARHCAQALERARLFAETQTLNDELEKRVQKRTAQLLAANARLETEVAERRQIAEQLELSREQLRRLALHLQAVREEERTHLAREVHDAVGQLLTGLKMDVAWLGHRLAEDGSPRVDKVREMTELLDSAIKSVRQIATELRPAILDDIGLAAAIEWQVREFESRSGIACRYTSTLEEIPLEAEHSTAVFRLVQETLTNVARHAQASQVEISLGEVDGFLSLQVRDNGRGITEEELRGSKSLGLLGMRERAQRLAGQLDIQGAPGQGTTVTMRVPLSVRLESDAYAS